MSKEARCKVKICGITSTHDACLAADAGADYIGVLVDVAASERTLDTLRAAEISKDSPIPTVLLLYDRTNVRYPASSFQNPTLCCSTSWPKRHPSRLKNSNVFLTANFGNLFTFPPEILRMSI